MASVFLLFMILFSFIVSCGTMIKDFRFSMAKKRKKKIEVDAEEY